MDRTQILLLWIPLFLFASDIYNIFSPQYSDDGHHRHHHHPSSISQPAVQKSSSSEFLTEKGSGLGAIGYGNTVTIDFCASCSYRGTATTMKNMLETQFPGINVILANYPAPFPKRVLSKLVSVGQMGVMTLILAGEHIFPRLGFAVPPPWYFSLRANKFGTMSSTWLLGNFLQSFLQSSGAFEVYCNGKLIFSKLQQGRFPGEIELKDLVAPMIAGSPVADVLGGARWS